MNTQNPGENGRRNRNNVIEWQAVAGMCDRLIRHYFGVDYDIVWDAIVNKISC
jgi:uncharacterized protein with HEPN domain